MARMGELLQTAIPAAAGLLVAYQGAISHTGRLRRVIRANVELLQQLPDDHPSRPALTAHIDRLVSALVQRERRRFGVEPITPAGISFGISCAAIVISLFGLVYGTLEATGWYRRDPTPIPPRDAWIVVAFYALLVVWFTGRAVLARRRSRTAAAPVEDPAVGVGLPWPDAGR
jgi:hypothetical protein